jgi:hypothetical protein
MGCASSKDKSFTLNIYGSGRKSLSDLKPPLESHKNKLQAFKSRSKMLKKDVSPLRATFISYDTEESKIKNNCSMASLNN